MKTSNEIFKDIREMGLSIPRKIVANGNYALAKSYGGLIYVSGQLSRTEDDRKVISGPIFADDPLDDAIEAAKICFVRALVAMHENLGDLKRVKHILHIRGFVNAATGFDRHSQVLDHVSNMSVELFGRDVGAHCRTALGASSLPSNGLVEVEIVAAIDENND